MPCIGDEKTSKKQGQWIGLFYLTLSDISAEINTRKIKMEGVKFLSPPK
jgi:hypothetical protein